MTATHSLSAADLDRYRGFADAYLAAAAREHTHHETADPAQATTSDTVDLRARLCAGTVPALLAHIDWLTQENRRLEQQHTDDCLQACARHRRRRRKTGDEEDTAAKLSALLGSLTAELTAAQMELAQLRAETPKAVA